jgi:hypothetical protein
MPENPFTSRPGVKFADFDEEAAHRLFGLPAPVRANETSTCAVCGALGRHDTVRTIVRLDPRNMARLGVRPVNGVALKYSLCVPCGGRPEEVAAAERALWRQVFGDPAAN